MKVLVVQPPIEEHPLDWTEEDEEVLRFRVTRSTGDSRDTAEAIATCMCMDFIDSDYMLRAVRCCLTLRDLDGMRGEWLREEAARHTAQCDANHISEIFRYSS